MTQKNIQIFQDALAKYYGGKPDQATLDILVDSQSWG